MRKEIRYIAFDGLSFPTEEACLRYERTSILLNPEHIRYYTDDGKYVIDPNEYTLLDSNRFKVYTVEGLTAYNNYCINHGIATPDLPKYAGEKYFPLHYRLINSKWFCYEDELERLMIEIDTSFLDKQATADESHNLVMEQFI